MFFRRYPVSDDLRDWMSESFGWAAAQGLLTSATPLVLPTRDFFTAPRGEDPATARAIAEDLKRLLGLAGTAIAVEPADMPGVEHRLDYNALSATAGTWQGDGSGEGVIRYDPALMRQPLAFLSVMTHELMHHVLHGIAEYPPGGPEAEELSTDLHMITCGFGVIALAGAEQAGWQGYMSQPSRAHALALFLAARGLAPDTALAHLPARSAGFLRKAIREVDRSGEGAALRSHFEVPRA